MQESIKSEYLFRFFICSYPIVKKKKKTGSTMIINGPKWPLYLTWFGMIWQHLPLINFNRGICFICKGKRLAWFDPIWILNNKINVKCFQIIIFNLIIGPCLKYNLQLLSFITAMVNNLRSKHPNLKIYLYSWQYFCLFVLYQTWKDWKSHGGWAG